MKNALEVLEFLISCYKSEMEGTKQYEEDKDNIEKARKYIIRKLKQK